MCIDNNGCKYSTRLRSSPAYNYWNRTVTDKHIAKMNIYTFTWTWYFQWNQFHQLLGTIGKFPIFCSIFSILYHHAILYFWWHCPDTWNRYIYQLLREFICIMQTWTLVTMLAKYNNWKCKLNIRSNIT